MSEINRPTVNSEMIFAAAKEIGERIDGHPEDIAEQYRHPMDGYELARELNMNCMWDIRFEDVEDLDGMRSLVDSRLRDAEKQWFAENDIQPPLPVGTRIREGLIEGICAHSPARYLVKENGCTRKGQWLLVKFEDAKPAEEVSA